jgi:sugar phosphate isomerase/epimerase
MENSGQPIGSMAMLVEAVRERMPAEYRHFLGLCPDPTNQLRRFPDTDPLADLEALPLDMVKIVHFKQARDGRPHPTVDTGDMDCAGMLRVLKDKGYQGAAIMEIPPAQDVLDNLSASFAYLEDAAK